MNFVFLPDFVYFCRTNCPLENVMNEYVCLKPEQDPMGTAISDYFRTGRAARLRVLSSMFDEDELPVVTLFRDETAMPEIERKALELASGRVLDIGAGAGCHALALQQRGFSVTAIDVSPLSVETERLRGVVDARCVDFFDPSFVGSYDTLLLLMNGIGIVGRLVRLPEFFMRAKQLLTTGGQILLDSSDLRYVYEDEDGSWDIDLNAAYYGEVDFQMKYRQITGVPFDWLYVDFDTLAGYAMENGFRAEKMTDGQHYDYLARLTLVR